MKTLSLLIALLIFYSTSSYTQAKTESDTTKFSKDKIILSQDMKSFTINGFNYWVGSNWKNLDYKMGNKTEAKLFIQKARSNSLTSNILMGAGAAVCLSGLGILISDSDDATIGFLAFEGVGASLITFGIFKKNNSQENILKAIEIYNSNKNW